MLLSKDIQVGDRFIVVKDGLTQFSDNFMLNGPHLSDDNYPKQKMIVDTEFEIIKKHKKVPGAERIYRVKVIDQKLMYEVFEKDILMRCERSAPAPLDKPIKYSLHELAPMIFCAKFENSYDMAMTFLRAQEFYESPSPNFKEQSFLIQDYMRWYAQNQGNGIFSYPTDWGGFNVPSRVIDQVVQPGFVKDWNFYDTEMKKIHAELNQASDYQRYYLIGTINGDQQTLRHEVAHGLFYVNYTYRARMEWLLANNNARMNEMYAVLKEMGYAKSVWADEAQAYFTTGLTDQMKANPILADPTVLAEFQNEYNEYSKEILFDL